MPFMNDLQEHNAPEKALLLIVDDDPLIADTLSFSLSAFFEVITSHSRAHCLQLLGQLRRAPELALVDLGLPPFPHRPDEGFALIGELLNLSPEIRIVVLSGQSDADNARHARVLGAVDFVSKPALPAELKEILERALRFRAMDSRNAPQDAPSPLVGNSAAILKLRLQLQQYAESPFPVLIEGESGSGKEIVAGLLHRQARRRTQAFLAINCAALSAGLVESTLFGHVKGAFTGAAASCTGYFEDAGEGTLFLDEIGELPLDLQAKLLRVIENGEYQRLGETRKRTSRARIIAATNRDLRQEVRRGNFRTDLYHRLSVFTITVPPLREMEGDRHLLRDHFCRHYATQSRQPSFHLSEEAHQLWSHYAFPGNVRELRNIVIRLIAKYAGETVSYRALEAELDLQDGPAPAEPLESSAPHADNEAVIAEAVQCLQLSTPFYLDRLLAETERNYIEAALRLSHGNVSQAARLLGINRTTLYNRMESSAREQ